MPIDLNEAMDYHGQGDLDRAARIYESALAENPDEPEALHLLGLVALQRGDPHRAVAMIGRAISLRPTVATYYANLGEAYWALGQADRVVACCQAALRLEPESPGVLCNLGSTLAALGDLEAAVGYLQEAIQMAPDFAAARNNLANALRLKGDKLGAVVQFEHGVRLAPESAAAWNNLGEMNLALGRPEAALAHCREAVRLNPGFPEARNSLGRAFHMLGRLDEAEVCFRHAIRLRPSFAAAHACLAGLLEELGALDDSLATLREAIRHDPRHAGSWARLATRLGARLSESERAAIEGLLKESGGLTLDDRWSLAFGLAHALDARGEFDRADGLFAQANAMQRADFEARGLGYDSESHRSFVDRLIATFTPEFFERVRDGGLDTERPVFVVGMPRSGTTLAEQVLASHPRVYGAGELRLVRQTFEALPTATGRHADSPLDCVAQLNGASLGNLARAHLDALNALNASADRIVDKMPENTLYLGLIAAMFPRARIIHCRRDPRDVALSCWMTHFAEMRWACDQDHIASRIIENGRVMAQWRRVLPIPILELDYEAMVADLEGTSRQLVDWCGLDWDPACLDFHKTRRPVRTTSVAQVRRPIYSSSVGRWKNYERPLASMFAKLGNRP
ncbi:MAG: tetratricopeptide repeat-containing sulfotransferase family protein [Isosphaeraceae bacterium]